VPTPQALGTTVERPAPALLWVAAALSVIAACSARDLWAPDEPRYGLVAREMLERGSWLVPTLAGEPYAEKPPLAYWAMAAAGAVGGGVGAVAARLACALLAASAVLSVARLGRRWFGDPAMGDTAGVLFATAGLVLWNGSRAGLDLPMTAFVLLAVEAATGVVVRRSWPAAVGFGAALGAGVLAKGPHALYVPVAATVGGCVAAGAARRLLDVRWLAGLAVAAAVVLAWLLPALEAGGEAYRSRLLGQLSDRVSGEAVPHRNPFPYLLLLLPVAALPWTPFALPGIRAAARASSEPREHRFGLGASLGAVVLPLVLLSVPASKRDVYLLPLLPFVALLAAWTLHRREPRAGLASRGTWASAVLAVLAAGAVAAPVAAGPVADAYARGGPEAQAAAEGVRVLQRSAVVFALGAVALLCASGALAAARLRRHRFAGVRAAAVALGAAWVVVATAVLPAFDGTKTHEAPAALARREAPGRALTIAGFSDRSVLWWYGPRDLRKEDDAESLASLLAPDAAPALVLAKGSHWRDLLERGAPAAVRTLSEARVLATPTVGGTPFVLVENAPGRGSPAEGR
jgi:4-amino-4-deoxy-L-arabinose transferase-like glycosyltransferase